MNTHYIYWHQNLRSAEPQQVLYPDDTNDTTLGTALRAALKLL